MFFRLRAESKNNGFGDIQYWLPHSIEGTPTSCCDGTCSKEGASICSDDATNSARGLGSRTRSQGGASTFSDNATNAMEGALAFNGGPIKNGLRYGIFQPVFYNRMCLYFE